MKIIFLIENPNTQCTNYLKATELSAIQKAQKGDALYIFIFTYEKQFDTDNPCQENPELMHRVRCTM
jgi:hypothetical protein